MSEKKKSSRSLAGIAGIVAVATLISKIFGLVRQQAIAAAFGVGVAADAYYFAYKIPGFLLVLLGGINGPFHSAIVSVLAKREKSEAAPLVETITTIVGGILLIVSVSLFFLAPFFISLFAPGLQAEGRAIAIQQLQIMAPMALLAGLIGIGFGTLNAADMYWLPSVSPLFSSITIIIGLGFLSYQLGDQINAPKYVIVGAKLLAWGTLTGAILQWLIQLVAQWRAGMGAFRLRFDWNQPGVKQVLQLMGPATLTSGMLQINLLTDTFFTSFIPQSESALNFSGLLIQTPLGIISNMILVPLMPVLSRLTDPQDWPDLKTRIRQGLLFTALTMLPLSALMITLAFPIVRIIYERGAFDKQASQLVASVLIASSLGMFFYLGRDVLVRVFYALGDGQTPFRISMVNIFFNAVFDFIFVNLLGAPGIVLATVMVNVIAMGALLWFLNRKLNGLPLKEWTWPFLGLAGCSAIAGLASWGTSWSFQQLLKPNGLVLLLLQVAVAGGFGLCIFALLATRLNLPEVDMFLGRIRERFAR